MTPDFERHLAEALAGLDQGSDVEAVLAEFPEEAGQLTPLLEAAAYARDTLDFFEPPSAAGLASGRRRMLEAAARKRAATGQPWWESVLAALRHAPAQVFQTARDTIGQLFRTPARGLAMAAVLLALVVVAGGATVVAAADSLPGDPLYGVKRTGERVRLALTTDPAARASLHARFNQERQTEARAVANLGRRARLQFEGVLERRTDGTWVVDGMALIVDPTLVEGEPAPGSSLVLDVVSPGDGTLHVERVTTPGGPGPMPGPGRLGPSATPAAAPEMPATRVAPTPHATQTPMPTRPTHGGPMMGQETASPQPTPEPGEPMMGQPTASPEPTHGPMEPGPGMGQPTASPEPTHGSTGPEMGHPAPTAAPTQEPAPTQVPPTQVAPTDTPAPSPTHHGPMMPHPTHTPGGGHPGGPGGPGRP